LPAFSGCNNETLEIIACGDDQVIIIDNETSDSVAVNIVWRWKASDAADLPDVYQRYMSTVDDCKPVDGDNRLLITSSSGGVVLVDRETKRSLFYAHVPNAHSAEFLPGNRIVVALSTNPDGNSIEVFDVNKPDEVIYKDSLYSAHGVIWMPEIKQLFALGFDVLRAYSLKNWDKENPELSLMKSWTLPGKSGHDLVSASGNRLILTTVDGVWNFDIQKEAFSPFSPLESVSNVKSINYNEDNQRLIYTKGEISWWTHHIYCKNPDKILTIPDINLYKVRLISD
jgi:hypothetical protein